MKNRDIGISATRAIAMLLIIFTHLIREIPNVSFFAQITNAAIYTFLFLSGWLYGKKIVPDFKRWLFLRMKRLLIPVYLWILFIFTFSALFIGKISLNSILIYVFNLQGILGGKRGIDHLWFVTAIMFCYMLTPVLQKFKIRILELDNIKKFVLLIILLIIQVSVSILWNQQIGVYLSYLIAYTLGYYLTSLWDGKLSNKNLCLLTVLVLGSFFLRMISRKFFDGTALYNAAIVANTQLILGIYIFVFVNHFQFFYKGKIMTKAINFFDSFSYEMFITHYAFIVGPLTIWGNFGIMPDSILIILATIISGYILKRITNLFYLN